MSTSESVDAIEGRHQAPRRDRPMVDRVGLEILGFILGGATAVVIAIAVLAVRSHVTASVALERGAPVVPAVFSPQR